MTFSLAQPQGAGHRILTTFLPRNLHFFDIHLHTVAPLVLAEEPRLSRASRADAPDRRIAEVAASAADGCGCDANVMRPVEPDPGPHRTKVQRATRLLDEPHRLPGDT